MKRFGFIALIVMIGAIIISSFFFIGKDAVKEDTIAFIQEIVKNEYSEQLTDEENAEIQAFFDSFRENNLPHPLIDGVEIHYYDVFTPPTENENFLQYISVKYEPIAGGGYDTDINFEYILYDVETGNPEEVYFAKLIIRSYDADLTNKELMFVSPMEKQK
ncbi:hypothetical protein AWH56_022805 [Anaerobacillus isosaccharinicus]|uniref:DUF3993 domain-containing protein n=1 Tax=Anaerobacillus isosaccharinicus TaxID=1532552 RepID=A0A1S2LPY4_9BACI|nr:hypothetical protein [Anaerobacillus isosaccharinicus]MBA5586266.1 hypothetical protein [Anaerobacillus isosaccharinicus]QOY35482.1 hypothetical protein AWH56_022805 [Anaerobacillus isosaccharinicus]